MARRLFSHDPETKITKWWNDSDDSDEIVMHTEQDISDLLELNKAQYNSHGKLSKWGDWCKVASIPISMYYDLMRQGKLHDKAYLTRMLNSNEFQHLRTRPGKVDVRLEK